MKPLAISLVLMLLVACAPMPAPDLSAAQATYMAAQTIATAQAGQATQSAGAVGTATAESATRTYAATAAVATTTAESLAVQMTVQAMQLDATRQSLSIAATGTAVSHVAQAEQRLIADEATRLAHQRQREIISMERERLWGYIWPVVILLITVGLCTFLGSLAWRLHRLSQPVRDENGRPIALPSGAYQVVSSRPALPAPAPVDDLPVPVRDPIILPPLADGHILITGPTDAGKSTAMRALLCHRDNVVVLDPHSAPGDWNNHRVIGDGRDFQAIGEFMRWMLLELERRAQERARGVRDFETLTVATDEMPAIADELGRGVDTIWRKWLREGRKFRLFFLASSQSTRVKTLGIAGEGDVLANFKGVLYLGESAVEAFPDLATGMERPAILRTLRGPQPVIIPNVPEGRLGTVQPASAMPPVTGLRTDWGDVSPAQIADILRRARAGESGRAIETAVFGYAGGKAYHMVRLVLERFGAVATNGRVLMQ